MDVIRGVRLHIMQIYCTHGYDVNWHANVFLIQLGGDGSTVSIAILLFADDPSTRRHVAERVDVLIQRMRRSPQRMRWFRVGGDYDCCIPSQRAESIFIVRANRSVISPTSDRFWIPLHRSVQHSALEVLAVCERSSIRAHPHSCVRSSPKNRRNSVETVNEFVNKQCRAWRRTDSRSGRSSTSRIRARRDECV